MNESTPQQPSHPNAVPPQPTGVTLGPPIAGAATGPEPSQASPAEEQPTRPQAGQPAYAQPPQAQYVPPTYGQQGYGYPPYPPPPAYGYGAYPEPERRKGRGWLIAVGIIVVLFIMIIAFCSWAGSIFTGVEPSVTSGDAVALIHIDGVIAGTSGSLTGASVTPESILAQLKQADEDSSIKAILLRVDSPGGTVAASEEIATEVGRATKPVVVSIGDAGASGAYMISSQSDWIVAGPGSDVGSIGVILEVPDLETLLNKLGVKFAVIHAGKYKDIGSPYRSLTATETKMLQEQVDIAYGQFIDLVAKGRKMPASKVRELATGMAWAGSQAKTYGLVDQIGTYNDALDKAAKLGGITGTPQVVDLGGTSFGNLLNAILGVEEKLGLIGKALDSSALNDATSRPVAQ
jgi:protease-4